MDDLIKTITDRFDDIDPSKAKEIVGTVAEYLSEKLPGGIGDEVAGFLGGEGFDAGDLLGKAGDALGGLFGGGDEEHLPSGRTANGGVRRTPPSYVPATRPMNRPA